ncbi:MAG: CBS domain-containing protein [Candidatus Lokiarchaeota archaeon]|nr:CBS domain-containing protein [Candidatus Lokiarchaeota archaeon]
MFILLPNLAKIKDLRKKLNLSQKELSQKCNISQSSISRIENGGEDPPYSRVKIIFEYLENEKKKKKKISKKIEDITTKQLVSIDSNAKLKEAISLMNKYNISQLPIIENNRNLGSITSKKVQKLIIDNTDILNVNIMNLKELPFPEVKYDWSLKDVSNILLKYSAVLVKKYDKYLGIVTDADFLKISQY